MEHQDMIQKPSEENWTFLMTSEELMDLPYSQSIEYLGTLIDLSLDLRRKEGLTRAKTWAENLSERELTSKQRALLHYFISNIWANIAHIRKVEIQERTRENNEADRTNVWGWEQEETEKQIFHLRAAMMENDFCELPKVRQCQILTNLANLYDTVGRFVESIEYWRRAVSIISHFGMALGNMGVGLTHYAYSLYDTGHCNVFLQRALYYLKSALKTKIHPSARQSFESKRREIIAQLPSDMQNQDFDMKGYSLGDSELEVKYRQWCLANGLFLNPLNDLGAYPIAAQDIFTAPSIVYGLREAPYYHGFFNQLKQEFVSARYFYYEGIKATSVHFSDKDVLLYNTLDYPHYSLASERIKIAFRMTYSLFDKISYLLNYYMNLSIPERQVSFKTIWYRNQRRKGLKPEFDNRQNWPLRGLFWLSKDLFEDREGFKDSTEPDARDLAEIRNHLEHKYLKLHSKPLLGFGSNSTDDNTVNEFFSIFNDNLAFSLYNRDFDMKTLRLIKLARAALIYLSLSIHREEYLRRKESDSSGIVVGQNLDIWSDKWKL